MANVSVAVEIETRTEHDLSTVLQGVADDQSVNVGTLVPGHDNELKLTLVVIGAERRPQAKRVFAVRTAHDVRPALIAGEFAIGETQPRNRAAEAVAVGAHQVEAGLDR